MPHKDKAASNEYVRKWTAQKRAAEREIKLAFENGFYARGPHKGCPKPRNKRRRDICAEDPVKFMQTYGAHSFYLDFTPGQLEEVRIAEAVIRHGGSYAFAAPRGDGKTTRIEWLTIWAVVNGYHRCVVPVGADAGAAEQIMDNIKFELLTNDLLAEDYPEICVPARLADDSPQRAKTLTLNGESIRFQWGTDSIVLPSIPGSKSRGSVIIPRGLTGRLRGMKFKIEGVGDIRPTLFLLDDPQNDISARSPSQCKHREKLVLGAVLGSGGPTDAISAFMPCTIIEEGDLAARFLDRESKPEWHGTTRAMVVQFPDSIRKTWEKSPDMLPKVWREYDEMRKDEFRAGEIIPVKANRFYKKNIVALEEGSEVDNPQRIHPACITALQTAMNLYFDRGREVFFAEYQNSPESISAMEINISPSIVASRVNGFQMYEVPADAAFLVSMADVNYVGLNYAVIAFTNDLTAYIVDYGKYPEGFRRLVTKGATEHEANRKVADGVKKLHDMLSERMYLQNNEPRAIDLQLFDANFWTKTIHAAIRSIRRPRQVMADRGTESKKYYPARTAIAVGKAKHQCHIEKATLSGVNQVRHNADYWRMYAQKALMVEPGIPGSLSFYGNAASTHSRISEEICAEILRRYVPGEPELYAWGRVPNQANDLLDAVVGCYRAAVILGATPPGQEVAQKRKKRRRSNRVGSSTNIRRKY